MPPRLNHSWGHVLEQVGRDVQRTDHGQLADLTQQRFETELARVGLQLNEQSRLTRFVDKAFQRLDTMQFEALERPCAERPLERRACSTHNPVRATRRLDTQQTTTT